MRWRLTIVVTLLIVLLLPSVAGANVIEARRRELARIRAQMQQAEQRAARADRQARSVLGELQVIERDIDRTTTELRSLENRVRVAEGEIRKLNGELVNANGRLNQRNEQLGVRLRALYERGAISYLEVLLNARNFADFVNRFFLLRTVINQDIFIYHAVQEEKAQVEDKKAAVELRQQELTTLREQTRVRQANLVNRAASRTTILNRLNQDKEQAVRAHAELDRLAKEIDEIIRQLQARNRGTGTGTFVWPTPGFTRITSPFGWRNHPIFRTREFHSGIDIGARQGSNIVATDGGEVIWADWLGGYGKTIIISHGEFTTLYAHASTLLVADGDKVAQGQVVARIGSTGNSTGPHLHFEVRNRGGTRLNPVEHVRP
ncbi:MAG: Murein hydrolase activator EnvC [Firmicutes bacterium]|nr:Murein hydrolase activator EnvC [Bacillota bacterium]